MRRFEIRVWASLFLSGFSALLLEVIWVRLALFVFGTTTQASTAVLSTFMGGLALGNLFMERAIRKIKNPFRLYAIIEIVTASIAFCAGLFYLQFGLSPTFPEPLLIFGMLVPTFCMGLTVPLVIEGLDRSNVESDHATAWAYGFNTFGGAIGAIAASFLILPTAGLAASEIIAAGLLLLAAINLFSADVQKVTSEEDLGEEIVEVREPFSWLWVALAAWAGGTALSLEIVWTRLLSLILGPSVYALGVVLFVYLLAIAIGAAMVPSQLRRRSSADLLMVGFILLGTSIAWSVLSFGFLPYLFVEGVRRFELRPSQLHFLELFLSVVAIAPSALLHGILLPTLISAGSGNRPRAETAARLFGANTTGAIAGIIITGLFAIPHIGFLPILTLIMGGDFILGLVWFSRSATLGTLRQRGFVVGLVILFIGLFSFRAEGFWDRSVLASGVYKYAVGDALRGGAGKIELGEILFYREGISSTVAVIKTANDRVLSVDGKADASVAGDRSTQVLLAALPLSLSENADRALVIGFASGVTAGVATLFSDVEVTAVEIEPAVYEASTFFLDVNHGPIRSPHRQIVGDARHFLSRTSESYDVITSEPSNPWMSGVAPLFTKEFFEIAKVRLRKGGVMCQWLPIYGMSRDLVASVVHTFHEVFPELMIFESVEGYDLLLIGSMEKLSLEMVKLEERWKRKELLEELSGIGIVRGVDLAGRFLMGGEGARVLGRNAIINRDGNGYLEFHAPLSLHLRTADENHTFLVSMSEGILPYLSSSDQSGTLRNTLAERFFRRGDTRLVKLVLP